MLQDQETPPRFSLSRRRSFRQGSRERDDRGWTLLHIDARKGDLKEVKRLLDEGVDVNMPAWGPKSQGETPLHLAALGGHLKVMDELLERGANIDARTKGACGWTPLHSAAKERNKKAIKFLIENGAFLPPDIYDHRFNPPLHYCSGLEWAYEIKRLQEDDLSADVRSDQEELFKMQSDKAALSKMLMAKRKRSETAADLPSQMAEKPRGQSSKSRRQAGSPEGHTVTIRIPSAEVARGAPDLPLMESGDIFVPAWSIRSSEGLIGNTRNCYDFIKNMVPPSDVAAAIEQDTPSLVRLICDSVAMVNCYSNSTVSRLEALDKELSAANQRYERVKAARAAEKEELQQHRRAVDNATLTLQIQSAKNVKLREEVARLEQEVPELVARFKASQQYKDELNAYSLDAFEKGYELCQEDVKRVYPDVDLKLVRDAVEDVAQAAADRAEEGGGGGGVEGGDGGAGGSGAGAA